jgi:hypothetical protein
VSRPGFLLPRARRAVESFNCAGRMTGTTARLYCRGPALLPRAGRAVESFNCAGRMTGVAARLFIAARPSSRREF